MNLAVATKSNQITNSVQRQHRVVSLLPSATEILCAIGGRKMLIGRSHEDNFPPSVTSLPILTGSVFIIYSIN